MVSLLLLLQTPAQFAADPCAVYAASLNAVPPAVILEIDGSNFGQSSAYTSVAMTNGTTKYSLCDADVP